MKTHQRNISTAALNRDRMKATQAGSSGISVLKSAGSYVY